MMPAALGVTGLTPAAESLAGERQQAAQYELSRWRFTDTWPVSAHVDAAQFVMMVVSCGRE